MIITIREINQRKKLKYSRVRTEEMMNALKNDLLSQNWEIVYKEIDVETAYNTFFKTIHNIV